MMNVNISFICEDMNENIKFFFIGCKQNVFQFKISATFKMLAILKKQNIFEHIFVTNCGINTNSFK